MKFTLEIDVDHPSFAPPEQAPKPHGDQPARNWDVALILREFADRLQKAPYLVGGELKDRFGNTVGKAGYTEENLPPPGREPHELCPACSDPFGGAR